MSLMTDAEAVLFIMIVALSVALAQVAGWIAATNKIQLASQDLRNGCLDDGNSTKARVEGRPGASGSARRSAGQERALS